MITSLLAKEKRTTKSDNQSELAFYTRNNHNISRRQRGNRMPLLQDVGSYNLEL